MTQSSHGAMYVIFEYCNLLKMFYSLPLPKLVYHKTNCESNELLIVAALDFVMYKLIYFVQGKQGYDTSLDHYGNEIQ